MTTEVVDHPIVFIVGAIDQTGKMMIEEFDKPTGTVRLRLGACNRN